MFRNIISFVQIILYLLSPFTAFALAKTTNAVDLNFTAMFVIIVISQWLAIMTLDKAIKE